MGKSFDVWRLIGKCGFAIFLVMVLGWSHEQGHHGFSMLLSAIGGIWVWEQTT